MATKSTTTSSDAKTEQEKSAPDPVSKSVEPERAQTVEEQGINPRDPYPTGNPPKPESKPVEAPTNSPPAKE